MKKNNLNLKSFAFLFIISTWFSFAQEIAISGVVNDATGLPIPGVNVIKKGTNVGTVTDFDGVFSIQVEVGSTVSFSFVGYVTQDLVITNSSQLTVTMAEDLAQLDEVVVVGYGTQKKSVVTGAISGVKQSELEDLPITRVEQTLQGRVSGITIAANSGQPGSASTVRVRGVTTLGNNEPLWVVDGVVIDSGGIGFLNQSDIESVEVLKDAASQAIYGARAATGVIIITTKKGKSGKLSVNYNGYVGVSSPAKKLDLLNATEYTTLLNEKSVNGGGSILFSDPSSYGEGTDWQSEIFNNSAKRTSHELSLSGGNDVSKYYASFGYNDQEGIVMSDISKYTRKNIRLNSTHKITDKLTFGQTVGYSNEKNTGIASNTEFGGPLSSAVNLDPLTPVVETDATLVGKAPYTNAGVLRDSNGNPYGISALVAQEMANPLAFQQTQLGNYSWADNFVGNAYLEYEPIEGLKFRSTLGGKLAYWGNESYTPISYLNASSITTQNNISRGTDKGFGWNLENVVSYTKSIKSHNFSVLLGQGVYVDNISTGESVTYYDIPVDSYKDASFNFETATDQIDAAAWAGTEHTVTSLFSRLNYDFDERYLLTAIIRRDGSSRFGANNKYGVFPSFSTGWVPSKEAFWKENDIVNQLKIRGGYGITGNDNIGDFKYLSTVSGGRNYTIGTSGSVTIGSSPDAPSNPDLKWEETSQLNIGFDARLFNTISVAFDWYKKETSGILQDVTIPGYVGAVGSPTGNVADMENTGIDLELGYNKQINEVNLSLNGNVSFLDNTVTFLGNGVDFLSGGETIQSSTYPITRTQVGQAVNSFYGFKTNGIFQNQAEIDSYVNSAGTVIQPNAQPGDFKWKDLDDNGTIDSDDRDFLGSSIPKITFGFTLNLDYKNFDFLLFCQGASGNKIFQGLRRLDVENANYQTSALGRWVGEGTSNNYPRLTTNDTNNNFSNPSDFYLEDGDYLRFKTVQIGYSLPTDMLNKYGINKLRVYVTSENLLTFTKYSGYDPEIGGGVFGIDRGYYPQAITNQIGINLQF